MIYTTPSNEHPAWHAVDKDVTRENLTYADAVLLATLSGTQFGRKSDGGGQLFTPGGLVVPTVDEQAAVDWFVRNITAEYALWEAEKPERTAIREAKEAEVEAAKVDDPK